MIEYKDFLSILGSFTAALVAYFIYTKHVESLQNQSIFNMIEKYRSAEMYIAVKHLWSFYRDDCGCDEDTLINNYLKRVKADEDKIKTLENISEKVIYESNSLDHYRRMVTQFYDYLAFLFDKKIIPRSFISDLWTSRELAIIPNILIPLDYANAKYIQGKDFKDKHHLVSKTTAIKMKLKLYEYYKTTY